MINSTPVNVKESILQEGEDNIKDVREVVKKVQDVEMLKQCFKKHFFLKMLDKKSR